MSAGDGAGAAFSDRYAECYDIIYQDKDYAGESRFVAGLLQRFCPAEKPRVADLSCGTARHLMHLAEMGYRVAGSDISAQMIARAREAARARGLDIPLHNEPLQSAARIGGPFDAALSLFASVNYLTSMRDLRAALENVAALLEPGGLFVFDFWNGNAVLRDYSPVRVLRKARGDREVLRVSETSLDRLRNVATVRFDFTLFEGHCRLDRFQEEHRIRYHFPQDMQDHLDAAGFDLVHACPFMEPDAPLGETDWNVTFVGRKRA